MTIFGQKTVTRSDVYCVWVGQFHYHFKSLELSIFLCGLFLKSLLNLLQHCFCFMFFFLAMWDLGSLTKDWTHIPCTGRWCLNHWTTREVPSLLNYFYFSAFFFGPTSYYFTVITWQDGWSNCCKNRIKSVLLAFLFSYRCLTGIIFKVTVLFKSFL